MKYRTDKRIVMTLDAGGTNLVFSATQGFKEVVDPITLPTEGHDLERSLANIVQGFKEIQRILPEPPVAISFAFPGPTDYPNGIIGDAQNLTAYRGGVALGPMLKAKFGLPVYINNDGDLFAYGEAIGGLLPQVNDMLAGAGSPKRFENLFGITLGTGFGGGIVRNSELFVGDNSAAAEIWVTRNRVRPECFAEEGASIRAVQGAYARHLGHDQAPTPSPKEIFEIGLGTRPGNKEAALKAFTELGQVVGDALANAITLVDGLVVIGGGLAGAHSLFMPAVLAEMNGTIACYDGQAIPRMELKAFDLEDPEQKRAFLAGDVREIKVPGTNQTVVYDPMKRIGIGVSVLGTSRAVAVGAYAYALHALDQADRAEQA